MFFIVFSICASSHCWLFRTSDQCFGWPNSQHEAPGNLIQLGRSWMTFKWMLSSGVLMNVIRVSGLSHKQAIFSDFIRCGMDMWPYLPNRVLRQFDMFNASHAIHCNVSGMRLLIQHGRCCATQGSLELHPWLSALVLSGFSPLCHFARGGRVATSFCTFIVHPNTVIACATTNRVCTRWSLLLPSKSKWILLIFFPKLSL